MTVSRRSFLALSGAALTATAGCSALGSSKLSVEGSWLRPGYDHARTGHRPDGDGPGGDASVAWDRRFPFDSEAPGPVVVDGRLFVTHSSVATGDRPPRASVTALDASTGETAWTRVVATTPDRTYNVHTNSLVSDGVRVYCQTAGGLRAVGTDGADWWWFDNALSDQFVGSRAHPAVLDGTVFAPEVGGYDTVERLHALDAETGGVEWTATLDGWRADDQVSPTAVDGTVYASFTWTGVAALDAASGEERWRAELAANGPVTVRGNRAYLTTKQPNANTDYGYHLVALDTDSGAELWRSPIGMGWIRDVAVTDERVFCPSRRGLRAFDAESGDPVWEFTVEALDESYEYLQVGAGCPAVVGDTVYVAGAVQETDGSAVRGVFLALDRATGALRGRLPLEKNATTAASVVVVDGVAFAAYDTGRLYAVA